MPKDSNKDQAGTKPKPKDRKPVVKHDAPNDKWAATFIILAAIGAVAIALLTHYGLETPLVWTSFLTGLFLIVAIHLHWCSPTVKMLCVVASIFLFFGCLTWQSRLTIRKIELSSVPSLKSLSAASEPGPSPSPSSTQEPRVFLDIDPEKLLGFFDKYNEAQVDDLLKPYIRKWMELSGRVTNVENDLLVPRPGDKGLRYGIRVFVMTARQDKPKAKPLSSQCVFDEQRWMDRAKVLKNGEDIKMRGQLTAVWFFGFYLEHCEIIE